ncbi:alpha/beta hydrolase [Shewanella sp. WXL01]|uniref:alpha/beta fold hydrolase n=1 Tax=Shewanella sp. WXL01 TaxID=2709721 RepID=UPI0032AEAD2F
MLHESINKEIRCEAITLSLPQIELAGISYGDATKPILLCLHGWLDNLNSFIPLVNELSLQGILSHYQIICIDWPGHGLSAHRPGIYPLHWVDYIYDLHATIAQLKLRNSSVSIIGHSLGGIIASAYNAAFANSIDKLVLIEALVPMFESEQNIRSRLVKGIEAQSRFASKQLSQSAKTVDINTAVSARHQLTKLDKPWCELITERNLRSTEVGFVWRSDPRLKLDSLYRLSFSQVEQLMNATGTPSLLVLGTDGYKQLKSLPPKAKRWFNDLKTVLLEGDHHLHMGSAEQVATQIRAFILN